MLPQSLQKLTDELARLPGIGPRTAERLAFYLLRIDSGQSQNLAEALANLHESIKECEICHNFSESAICSICQDESRERQILAVVEDALDIVALEKTGSFKGLYHVLGGVISPIDGVGPKQLNITSLYTRLSSGEIKEIILATNPSTEGEATALYIQKNLPKAASKIRVSRLARGLPMGSDLEYADQVTLGRALEGRQVV